METVLVVIGVTAVLAWTTMWLAVGVAMTLAK